MPMSQREIYARRIRLARCALGMSVREFAVLVGLAPNTISAVENAGESLMGTHEAIDKKLSEIGFLKCFRDDGNSIGVRLYYNKMYTQEFPSAKVREFKKSKGPERHVLSDQEKSERDQLDFDRGSINSDYPLELWQRDQARIREEEREENNRRDKRVKNKNRMPRVLEPLGDHPVIVSDGRIYPPAEIIDRLCTGENPVFVWREYFTMTLDQLADKTGIPKVQLVRIETDMSMASAEDLNKLARALNLDLDQLQPKVTLLLPPQSCRGFQGARRQLICDRPVGNPKYSI